MKCGDFQRLLCVPQNLDPFPTRHTKVWAYIHVFMYLQWSIFNNIKELN